MAVVAGNSDRPTGPSISPERMMKLDDACAKMASAVRYLLPSCLCASIRDLLPGKRIARLDLLEYREGKTFSNVCYWSPDGSYGFSRSDISGIFKLPWNRLEHIMFGGPEFEASMQALNTGIEAKKQAGIEIFLGIPFIGSNGTALGAMVISNLTLGISPITPEDRELALLFAGKISKFIENLPK